MLKYGTDKPDLRNPLEICDLTSIFTREDVKFEIFKKLVKSGSIVRAIKTTNTKDKPRSFFDGIDKWAKDQGASGMAYFTIENDEEISAKGPVGKFFSADSIKLIYSLPEKSFVLINDDENKIYLAFIKKIINENKITEEDLKNYSFKSSSEIRDTLYSSYDIYLSEKYEIKVFQNTIERLKNNFR